MRRLEGKAKERRIRKGPLLKHHRVEAATVIQTAWRQHMAMIRFGKRIYGESGGLAEHGWAKIKRQFLAAVMLDPLAGATRLGAAMPKADW